MSATPSAEPASPEVEHLPGKDHTDWALLREMSDEEIDARAGGDPDAQPTDADFWQDARVTLPSGKTRVFLDLDDDVLAWFKARGKAYGERMNEALRAYVERRQDRSQAAGEIAEPSTPYDSPEPDRKPSG